MSERGRDAVESFFDFSRQMVKLNISEGQTSSDVVVQRGALREELPEQHMLGREYAIRTRRQEEALMRTEAILAASGCMSTVEELTSRGSVATTAMTAGAAVLRNYDFSTRNFQQRLPIASHRTAIVNLVSTTQAVIIRGATGCGKSTQVPQFLMEAAHAAGQGCNIVVTQPRRLAAVSLARRVCADRGWDLGTLVGYQVGLDTKHVTEDTKLLFCTTGVLLQQLVSKKGISSYTHIIVDEVHERTQEMDFLLILLRKMITLSTMPIKVVLMSATISVDLFSHYFTLFVAGEEGVMQKMRAPILDLDELESMSAHLISVFYLDELDALNAKMALPVWDEPDIGDNGYAAAVELISELNKLPGLGAVLVFLPGINEIEQLFDALTGAALTNRTLRWWIKPLHSILTMEEQGEVFLPAPDNRRKIILSTNIAESSITVPDIAYVVDFCLTKHLVCDIGSNFSSLQLAWASRSNCIQRAGRTGRTCPGRVYRLVPRQFFLEMNEQAAPEMLRGPLERVVLLAKILEMGSPQEILGLAPDAPDLLAINKAVLMLKEKSGLLRTLDKVLCVEDGDITFVGRIMAKLPVDPLIAKLLLLGHAFGVLSDCIIMGAAMTLKSIFSAPFQQRLDAYHNRLAWADGSCSDCICFLNAFLVWKLHRRDGSFSRSGRPGGEEAWANSWLLELRTLREVSLLVHDITARLSRMGVSEPKGSSRVSWTTTEKPLILKIVLAGAFYPNFYARGLTGGQVDEGKAVREVGGYNPRNTVYLSGMPPGQPKRLYASAVKKALGDCAPQMRVHGDSNSGKLYVSFCKVKVPVDGALTDPSYAFIPGQVEMGVYRAVKLRQLSVPIVLDLMRLPEALERAQRLGLQTERAFELPPERSYQPALPALTNSVLAPLIITHREEVGHFWIQQLTEENLELFEEMLRLLQQPDETVALTTLPRLGNVYAAPFVEGAGKRWFRAQLLDVKRQRSGITYAVHFIDYGNRETIATNDLRGLGPALEAMATTVPPAALECVLAGLAPCLVARGDGRWTINAEQDLEQLISERSELSGLVYSVVGGVVALTLFASKPGVAGIARSEVNVNDWLITQGHAQPIEESHLSKLNHRARERAGMASEAERAYAERLQRADEVPCEDVPPPPRELCSERVQLRGPSSPLEMRVYGMTREASRREVQVDSRSVNSVLLDTAPQDPHERLLVAAYVMQDARGFRVNLKHTTLVPNVHGLPALLCLAFAPTVEMRTDVARKRYVGALCGLGADEKGQALFPGHDMEVKFDTAFGPTDLDMVNRLRYWMNRCFVPDSNEVAVADECLHEAQRKIQRCIHSLLTTKRCSVPLDLRHRSYEWGLVLPEHRLAPCSGEKLGNNRLRGVFQFHWGVRLRLSEAAASVLSTKISRLDYVHELVASGRKGESWLICGACNYSVPDTKSMAEHLLLPEHKKKEADLRRLDRENAAVDNLPEYGR